MGKDLQTKELLGQIASEHFEIEVSDGLDRDVSEDADVGVSIAWIDRDCREQASAAGPSMTTPAKPSSAPYVLQRLRFSTCLLAAGLTLAVPLAGCDLFHSDFDVAVGNRTANTVSIFANGGKIGEVGSNLTATFTVEEFPTGRTMIDSAGSPTSPTLVAQVTFSAQDMTTGVLSAGVAATLVRGVTTYVDVARCVLIGGGPAPPCVSVSGATTGSQGNTTSGAN